METKVALSGLDREDPAVEVVRHTPALDGIRGLAILLVVVHHYGNLSNFHSLGMRSLNAMIGASWVGVDIFFALSGFLITGIVWESKDKLHREKNFYMRRALRLLPLYYGIWALLLLYVFLTHRPWDNAYFAYLLYFGNVASIYTLVIGIFFVSHLWSLAVEEQFYLLWPFLLWKIADIRLAMRVLAATALFSILLKLVFLAMHVGPRWDYVLLPTHVEGLALGSMLALAMRVPQWQIYLSVAGRYLPLILALLAVEMLYFHGLRPTDRGVLLFAIPLCSLASTLLIWNTLIPGSIYQRIMQTPVLRFYGRYSYGLYMYNFLLYQVLRKGLYTRISNVLPNHTVSGLLYLTCCMVLLTILSVMSFHLYETPFLKMKRYFVS